ncbi:MAG TPA: PQQ-binding-like beta-propeller repeat protein [Ktedonobacteraceae bacterium]|nr:PQQ-binding-like beta-propeller repeat protein [Ktedonobacteraceae bacterium]
MNQRPRQSGTFSQRLLRKRWGIAFLALTLVMVIAGTTIGLTYHQSAHAAGASLLVSPKGEAFTKIPISVQGSGYGANEAVNIYWNYTGPGTGTLMKTVNSDGAGSFSTSFRLPPSPAGMYTVGGVGQTSGSVATGTFQLSPGLTILPVAGGAGSSMTLSGNAFGASEAVKIFWNYTGPGTGTLLTTANSDVNGSFTVKTTVPTGSTQVIIPVVGVGQTSNSTGTFTYIVYPPTLALAPLSGSANIGLVVSAYGFAGLEKVNVYWNNGATPVASVKTTNYGYMGPTSIPVPAGTTPGSYQVKAIGQTTHLTITNNYTVVAPASNLRSASGPVGTSEYVTGQGYAPGEAVNLLWNYTGPGTGTQVASVVAGFAGNITASFNVPTATTGNYKVAAVGATSNSVTQNAFTVSNGVFANPASLPPGTNLTAAGSGFQPGEMVNIFLDSKSNPKLGTAPTDANGNISQSIGIPSATTPGAHSLIVVGSTSGLSFNTPVSVDTAWNDFGFDLAHDRNNPYENQLGASNVSQLQMRWKTPMGNGLWSSPVYANGTIYMVTANSILRAIDAATGTVKWQFDTGMNFRNVSTPVVDIANNMVFFGTLALKETYVPAPFYALNATTGALIWSELLPWSDFAFPTIAFHTIYLGMSHEAQFAMLYALDEFSGHINWVHPTNGGVWGAVGVDVNTNTVFSLIGNPTDQVAAFNATTGAIVWQFVLSNSGQDGQEASSQITVGGNGLIYVDTKTGFVYALNESNGTVAWKGATGLNNISSQAVANGKLFVGSEDSNFYAFNATTGAFLWKTPIGAHVDSSPAVANGVVYFGSYNNKIYGLDVNTGQILWSFSTKGASLTSPIVVNGWLYSGSTDGNLYAFSL